MLNDPQAIYLETVEWAVRTWLNSGAINVTEEDYLISYTPTRSGNLLIVFKFRDEDGAEYDTDIEIDAFQELINGTLTSTVISRLNETMDVIRQLNNEEDEASDDAGAQNEEEKVIGGIIQ